MARMRCIVTGGAGFIGSHVADHLVEAGHDVCIIDDLSTGLRDNVNPASEFVECSILDSKSIKPVFAGCDWVFHAAAWPCIQPSFDDPIAHERVNVEGTLNCLAAARDAGAKRFLYFGSAAVYGAPDRIPTPEDAAIQCNNPYALHKYAAERYALMLGERWKIPVLSLRLFNVYGPRSYKPGREHSAYSPVIGIFHHLHSQNKPLTITGNGEQTRDFVHVSDVARAFVSAAESDISGEVFNVGSGTSVSINTVARLISDNIEYIPERPNEIVDSCADISRISERLGWTPSISVEEGIRLFDGVRSCRQSSADRRR